MVGNGGWEGEVEIGKVDEGACCQGGPYLFSDAALFTGSTRAFFDETAGAQCSTMISGVQNNKAWIGMGIP